eukprot:358094-Chlamydomonas_euryale.AAC.3
MGGLGAQAQKKVGEGRRWAGGRAWVSGWVWVRGCGRVGGRVGAHLFVWAAKAGQRGALSFGPLQIHTQDSSCRLQRRVADKGFGSRRGGTGAVDWRCGAPKCQGASYKAGCR